ncbi:MAG: amidohydrolase [Sphingobacteriaceae bacterium]|jgi:predicted amidohydrolase|nr:MAG: amidohydrolase [Pedobacter sp.]
MLKITIFQTYIFWENIERNLYNMDAALSTIQEKTDLIILPEMFNTGFTMNVEKFAEKMNGKTMQWMHQQAKRFDCIVTGSLIIKEGQHYYNRLIWMQSDGTFKKYDKRHLFYLGGESKYYTAGKRRLIVELNGWKICPVLCYDLRFPVWLRNNRSAYDLLLVVASWPEKRSSHWRMLLQARSIENQSYVIGVNRYGHDGNEVYHSGNSMCIDPNGNTLYCKSDDEDLYTFTIYKEEVKKIRRALPFLKDADDFKIII